MTLRRPAWPACALALALLAGCGSADAPPPPPGTSPAPAPAPAAAASETPHFAIVSSADPALTARAGAAAEALREAYAAFFSALPENPSAAKPRLRLYATREEFQANNRSRPWAEAYYHRGLSHAYLDPGKPNPFHWLLHEVVHQLNREVTGYAREKWINEGLATYFGSSRLVEGRLQPGEMDLDAYPLFWLARWPLSGDWDTDVQAGRVIPLRALITGQGGPPLDATVNAHYLGYWSLSHFLLHHDGGRHAAGYRELIRHGGSLADFERHIGPVAVVEAQWYAYLLAKTGTGSGSLIIVNP
jgi:hypothetical protein